MNPGLSACEADTLPLSYTPDEKVGRQKRYVVSMLATKLQRHALKIDMRTDNDVTSP